MIVIACRIPLLFPLSVDIHCSCWFHSRLRCARFPDTRACLAAKQCVRVVKDMDSNSIELCPQGFESLRCRCRCFTEAWRLQMCGVALDVAVHTIVNKAQASSYGCRLSCRTCVTVTKWGMWIRYTKKSVQPLSTLCMLRSALNAATACQTRV